MIWGNRQVNTVYFSLKKLEMTWNLLETPSLKLLTFQLSNFRALASFCFIPDGILAQINHNVILRIPEMMPYPTQNCAPLWNVKLYL